MKTKIITLLAVATLVTLSFTLISVRHTGNKTETAPAAEQAAVQNEPIGGFVAEDKY
ncbi:MAG: hypothetical protein HRU69_09895 [Flammeovirgaceae bacterium]|nr:MAG: hypothetical protein HRU69_09895 [Flammeovirgaceae bacterium]